MNRTLLWYHWVGVWLPLCITACSEAPESPAVQTDPWPSQAEVLYQTREVIRYVDEQQRLNMERLQVLGVDPVSPAQQQGEPEGRQH